MKSDFCVPEFVFFLSQDDELVVANAVSIDHNLPEFILHMCVKTEYAVKCRAELITLSPREEQIITK